MGRLFEGFEILCTDYDHMLEKVGILFKGGHYSRKYGNPIPGRVHSALVGTPTDYNSMLQPDAAFKMVPEAAVYVDVGVAKQVKLNILHPMNITQI